MAAIVFDVRKAERRLLDAGAAGRRGIPSPGARLFLVTVFGWSPEHTHIDCTGKLEAGQFTSRCGGCSLLPSTPAHVTVPCQVISVLLQAADVPASRYLRKGCACQYVNERHSHSAGPR